jgi:hypothetical protein
MPDLEESLAAAQDKPGGRGKWLRKNSAFALLVIDECLLDEPDDDVRSMLLELLERRYDTTSTVFRTKYAKKDWHQRLGSGVHADAIMDCIVHNTIWITTGEMNMREHGGSITECPDGERRYPAGDHRHDPVALKGNIRWCSTAIVGGAHTTEYSGRCRQRRNLTLIIFPGRRFNCHYSVLQGRGTRLGVVSGRTLESLGCQECVACRRAVRRHPLGRPRPPCSRPRPRARRWFPAWPRRPRTAPGCRRQRRSEW